MHAWHARLVAQRMRSAHAHAWYEGRHATGLELARLLLRAWRSHAVIQAAERAIVMRVLQRVWRHWRDVLLEAQLRHEELAALAARRQSILRACWARWTQRTLSLPVLQLQRARVLRCALWRWQQRVQGRRMPRLAKAFALSTVGADALASWRHRLAHRQQVRALSYVWDTDTDACVMRVVCAVHRTRAATSTGGSAAHALSSWSGRRGRGPPG